MDMHTIIERIHMNFRRFVETYRVTRIWFKALKSGIWFAAVIFLSGSVHAARSNNLNYMVALSPDGSRVAIGKQQQGPQWSLFEGIFQQPLHRVTMPSGLYSPGIFVYSPNGKDLLFAATRGVAAEVVSTNNQSSASDVERFTTIDSLWRQQLTTKGKSPPDKLFEQTAISNVLPLLDGSIVFMGAVERMKSHARSPLFGGGYRVWTNYSWMRWKPGGDIAVINPRHYAFFSSASLIRDEAVFLIQERRRSGPSTNPTEYQMDVTALKPGVDLSDLARLVNVQSTRSEPHLQCDWAGSTCARVTTYNKDGYHAHRLEIIRNGKVCEVNGLPDRLERSEISRNGNAIALITRPNPRSDVGYQLAVLTIDASGCAGSRKFVTLP